MVTEELVRVRMAELRAEAESAQAAARIRAVRRAERRYVKARARLSRARSHAGYVGRPQVS